MSLPHRYRVHPARTFLVGRFSRSKASRAFALAIVPSAIVRRHRGNCHASQSSVRKPHEGKLKGNAEGKYLHSDLQLLLQISGTIKWKNIRVTDKRESHVRRESIARRGKARQGEGRRGKARLDASFSRHRKNRVLCLRAAAITICFFAFRSFGD